MRQVAIYVSVEDFLLLRKCKSLEAQGPGTPIEILETLKAFNACLRAAKETHWSPSAGFPGKQME